MTAYQVRIPESIDINAFEVQMIVASKLYEDGKLSSGQAAEIVGLSKRAFIELLGKYKVSVFSDSITALHSDIANA